jgi:hypothetical protein
MELAELRRTVSLDSPAESFALVDERQRLKRRRSGAGLIGRDTGHRSETSQVPWRGQSPSSMRWCTIFQVIGCLVMPGAREGKGPDARP